VLAACLPDLAMAGCQLQSKGNAITHIVHIQFDNVHFRRDNPNVPSDLEQMPNLLNFLEDNGTLLTRHHTPLISHTAVDILTALTGVYGDKFGVPIGNSLRYYNPDGSSTTAISFAYWTDPLDSVAASPTDTTPQMIDQQGKTHPAPWVPFTRAGCDVGAFSTANIELENIGLDVKTVFGAGSPEAAEALANPPDPATGASKAVADFEGIAIHCAQGSATCSTGRPDLLPQEPGGYAGFNGLFGNKYVAPVVFGGPAVDLDNNPIVDALGNAGFPGFSPTASQTLSYLAHMLEVGVPVVYGYISDAHDNHGIAGGTYGPGEAGYVAQLASYNTAFGEFFARLEGDGITKANTLFIFTADENDHFAGGPPSPLNCDGVTVPCTYAKIGEVNADLRRVLNTETNDTTPFAVHSDDAPTIYVTGNPSQTDPVTRTLEREMGGLTAVNPITGNIDMLTQALADHAEQALLHMITDDPNRTPTFILFANPDYFLFASSTTKCVPLSTCFVENPQPTFAWNHGDFQEEITKTWLGMVGPGVQQLGATDVIFSDHTDVRPTMLTLVGLKDSYSHDGRALFEVLEDAALPASLTKYGMTLHLLADALKQINAPRGVLGMTTLTGISTQALEGDDATYTQLEAQINLLAAQRNVIAGQMIPMLENAEFNGVPIDNGAAARLINQAQALLKSVK
jgi:hypothetical protein